MENSHEYVVMTRLRVSNVHRRSVRASERERYVRTYILFNAKMVHSPYRDASVPKLERLSE